MENDARYVNVIWKRGESTVLGFKDLVYFMTGLGGVTFNRRLLAIRDHYLFYYSKVPDDWKENNWKALKNRFPKKGVPIKDILFSRVVDQELAQDKSYAFEVLFPYSKMVKYKSSLREKALDTQKRWIFACDTEIIYEFWVT